MAKSAEEKAAAKAAKDAEKAAAKAAEDTAVVSWRGNTREYSREVHGDNFYELAEQFAAKVEGEVV